MEGVLGRDRGSVTVEAAIALCALVAVLVLALGGVLAVAAQLRCSDAAREAARLAARGELERGRSAAAQIAPVGAMVEITTVDDEVRARVTTGPFGTLLPGLHIGGEAVGSLEPGVGPGAENPAADGPGADGSGAGGGPVGSGTTGGASGGDRKGRP